MFEIYDRQKELTFNRHKKVVVAGCGGVGSWTSLFLAMTGTVQELALVDADVIEEHNLNRTPYRYNQIGQKKSIALAELIVERRPDIVVTAYDNWIENVRSMLIDKRDCLFLDCRDRVDKLSELSPVIGGYDKDNISLSFNYNNDAIFDSGIDSSGYTGTWLIPPVILASVIVFYLTKQELIEDTRNITMSISDIYKYIMEVK